METISRINFLKLFGSTLLAIGPARGFSISNSDHKKADCLPLGIRTIIHNLLDKNVSFWNTDWDGTMAIEALLSWKNKGVPQVLEYAKNWLDFHIENDLKLTDNEFYKTYSGPRSRIIRGKYLPFTMYSGFFGLPFPCYEIYKNKGDERAKEICLSVGNTILHKSARDQRGLVLHDDGVRHGDIYNTFTIPDTMYFVTKALMISSVLDDKIGIVYRDQALFQIKTGTSFYLDNDKNLASTVLYPTGVGKSFWCRASGWLSYALAGVLRLLPADHPEFENLANELKLLADGVKRFQGPKGGLRVLIDRPETPEEITGTAMCVASIKEAVDKGWIPDKYNDFLDRGWDFIKKHVSDDGNVTAVYSGWAIPAEEGKIIMDQSPANKGWIPAVILNAAFMMS